MKTSRVFRRNRFVPHPPSHTRCLRKLLRPSCVGRAFVRGVLPRSFCLRTRFEHSSFQVFSPPPNTHVCIYLHMSCMHYLAMASPDKRLLYSITARTAMHHLRPPARKPTHISSIEDESGSRASPVMSPRFCF